jgi:hypothetical protein
VPVYVDTSKLHDDSDHLKVFANQNASESVCGKRL